MEQRISIERLEQAVYGREVGYVAREVPLWWQEYAALDMTARTALAERGALERLATAEESLANYELSMQRGPIVEDDPVEQPKPSYGEVSPISPPSHSATEPSDTPSAPDVEPEPDTSGQGYMPVLVGIGVALLLVLAAVLIGRKRKSQKNY